MSTSATLEPVPAAAPVPSAPPVLRIHEAAGVRIVKPATLPVTLGRSLANDVCLEHPMISGRHASLEADARGLVLRDVGSANGLWLDGQRVKEVRVAANTTVYLSDVRVDLVVEEALPKTLQGSRLERPGGVGAPARAVLTGAKVLGCYSALVVCEALEVFARQWPPDRPEDLLSSAFLIWLALLLPAAGLALYSKLQSKRYNGARILVTLTALAAGFAVLDVVDDTLTYNLRLPVLRAVVPTGLALAIVLVALHAMLDTTFPGWPRRRRWLVAGALVSTGFAARSVHARLEHLQGSGRDRESAVGVPLVDPRLASTTTGGVLASLRASVAKVDGYREEDWRELLEQERGE